jgi:hypothetical protein
VTGVRQRPGECVQGARPAQARVKSQPSLATGDAIAAQAHAHAAHLLAQALVLALQLLDVLLRLRQLPCEHHNLQVFKLGCGRGRRALTAQRHAWRQAAGVPACAAGAAAAAGAQARAGCVRCKAGRGVCGACTAVSRQPWAPGRLCMAAYHACCARANLQSRPLPQQPGCGPHAAPRPPASPCPCHRPVGTPSSKASKQFSVRCQGTTGSSNTLKPVLPLPPTHREVERAVVNQRRVARGVYGQRRQRAPEGRGGVQGRIHGTGAGGGRIQQRRRAAGTARHTLHERNTSMAAERRARARVCVSVCVCAHACVSMCGCFHTPDTHPWLPLPRAWQR